MSQVATKTYRCSECGCIFNVNTDEELEKDKGICWDCYIKNQAVQRLGDWCPYADIYCRDRNCNDCDIVRCENVGEV